jgi:hypothetical protein
MLSSPDQDGSRHSSPPSHTSRRDPGPQFFQSPRAEPLAACHFEFRPRPTASPHSNALAGSPLLLPTPLGHSEHPRPFPLGKFDRRATVSPVSGEDHHTHKSRLIFLLSPPLTLASHPPPLECRLVDLSVPRHQRPTSSVSHTISHLAWCTLPPPSSPCPRPCRN